MSTLDNIKKLEEIIDHLKSSLFIHEIEFESNQSSSWYSEEYKTMDMKEIETERQDLIILQDHLKTLQVLNKYLDKSPENSSNPSRIPEN
jgi:hypothetical protein